MKRILYIINIVLLLLGCSSKFFRSSSVSDEANIITIPGEKSWVDTGLNIKKEEYIFIQGWGQIKASRISLTEVFTGRDYDYKVSPKGTYNFESSNYDYELINRGYKEEIKFPLPAAHLGPYPCYALIGKIGINGKPFLVGDKYTGEIQANGRLYLGINDYCFEDNSGEFHAKINLSKSPFNDNPVADNRKYIPFPSDFYNNINNKNILPDDKYVLLIFVDGLIPDVAKWMAFNGYLPNIKEYFIDNGVEIEYAYTNYPSDTVPSTSSLLTGLFSDKTGVKSQALFQRGFYNPSKTKATDLTYKFAPEKISKYLYDRNAMTLFDFFGLEYMATVAPVNLLSPPEDWLHIACNYVNNPFNAGVEGRENIDYVNFQHAMTFVGNKFYKWMFIWFDNTDRVSHFTPLGQYGATRKVIYKVDQYLGKLFKELKDSNKFEDTYIILFSDHGHMGGNGFVNQKWDIANDYFFQKLGFNVHKVIDWWVYPDSDPDDYVYLDDSLGTGHLKVFLPYYSQDSKNWNEYNNFYNLTHYRLANGDTVNLIEEILSYDVGENNLFPEKISSKPANFILCKLSENYVIVYKSPDNIALIHQIKSINNKNVVKYFPIKNFSVSPSGETKFSYHFDGIDPLNYINDKNFVIDKDSYKNIEDFLAEYHTYEEWLYATYKTEYPAAPFLFAKHLFWDEHLQDLAPMYDPDFIVVPNKGWALDHYKWVSTTHGYPNYESMHITLFIRGPGLLKNTVIEKPHSIVDITPTILYMLDREYQENEFDGKAIKEIFVKE